MADVGNFVYVTFRKPLVLPGTFGIVTNPGEIVYFDNGFGCKAGPEELEHTLTSTRNDALGHLHAVSDKFRKKMRCGCFDGLKAARQKYHVDEVIAQIEAGEDARDFLRAATHTREPRTGLYAACGIYAGNGPDSELFETFILDPPMPETEFHDTLHRSYPRGVGRIPDEVRDTAATSHGDLVGYNSFSVPEEARGLALFPRILAYNSGRTFSILP
ncbi:MAG: hypothetical protein HYW25_05530 [Candidatus Aenigmarchaeota archaeon]|nr:hypothetical protein [Candidatus Aenigmarchaeota archaeon]